MKPRMRSHESRGHVSVARNRHILVTIIKLVRTDGKIAQEVAFVIEVILDTEQPFPLAERDILRFVNDQHDVVPLRVIRKSNEALFAQIDPFRLFRRLRRMGEFELRRDQQLMPKSRLACLRGMNKVSANSYHKLWGYKDRGEHYESTQ